MRILITGLVLRKWYSYNAKTTFLFIDLNHVNLIQILMFSYCLQTSKRHKVAFAIHKFKPVKQTLQKTHAQNFNNR